MKMCSLAEVYASKPVTRSLPFSLKVLLENLLRNKDGVNVTDTQIQALTNWQPNANGENGAQTEIQFTPARVIMQDFTGVPCIVDLASMREAMQKLGGDPRKINPLKTAQLVIDHSLQIDCAGKNDALAQNMALEFERNSERYEFLKWGQGAFSNFEVIPPGVGIIHQVNIEKLAEVVSEDDEFTYFDTCVGTDSHTTMVNGLGVLGWGVGGIEAEATMLGQTISMLIPEVIGFKITGVQNDNVMATDIVLTITEQLRKLGVVGKFVEFYGDGVKNMPVAMRATISNMCPEFGATAAIFAPDEQTLEYLKLTGRSDEHIARVRAYCEKQGVFGVPRDDTRYSGTLTLDLGDIVPSIAGPKLPQSRIPLTSAKEQFEKDVEVYANNDRGNTNSLRNGDIVIASITSCTNTSNPEVLIAAGLLAKKASEKGLKPAKYTRTSFAPGSRVVAAYLQKAGLQNALDNLGFNVVGFGCATCIGNSGPNAPEISRQIAENDLAVVAVLSGNRNFEGRINPDVKMNYLASPPLVIAYALAGTMDFDFENDALGADENGKPIFLRDIWPSHEEINAVASQVINSKMYLDEYSANLQGDANWQALPNSASESFNWKEKSTYIRKAPYFDSLEATPKPLTNIENARVLALLGDSVTTDHISPAGAIKADSPAGKYLQENGISPANFNTYGSRRGNHEVMVRGTFANIRLKNLLLERFANDLRTGGLTYAFGADSDNSFNGIMSIFDASQKYLQENTPLIVIAGKEYGTGSSRDWAAKGTALLGVKAVIAESFERIHRSNLIGMGVLPLQFLADESAESLGLRGDESFTITGIDALNDHHQIHHHINLARVTAYPPAKTVNSPKKSQEPIEFTVNVRIDTETEAEYYRNGGILHYVLRRLAAENGRKEGE